MKNIGKVFEEDFKNSIPDHVLAYRLPDSAQSFGGNGNLRFSIKNPFDYLLWDSRSRLLFALELKSVKDKRISFERDKTEHGEIHYHQIAGLKHWNQYDGIICGFIINFRGADNTVFLGIDSFSRIISQTDKKSINLSDIEKSGQRYCVIKQERKITRYRYDIESFLSKCKD